MPPSGARRSPLETYAFPVIGTKRIDEITASDVLAVLDVEG